MLILWITSFVCGSVYIVLLNFIIFQNLRFPWITIKAGMGFRNMQNVFLDKIYWWSKMVTNDEEAMLYGSHKCWRLPYVRKEFLMSPSPPPDSRISKLPLSPKIPIPHLTKDFHSSLVKLYTIAEGVILLVSHRSAPSYSRYIKILRSTTYQVARQQLKELDKQTIK